MEKIWLSDDPWLDQHLGKIEQKALFCIDLVQKIFPGIKDDETERISVSLMKLNITELSYIEGINDRSLVRR
jgi:hypothetical protein